MATGKKQAIVVALIAAVGVVIAAAVTGLFGLVKSDGGGASQGSNNIGNCQINGDNNSCGGGSGGNSVPRPGPEPSVKAESDPPSSFPFQIVNTVVNGTDRGVVVRDCDREKCGRCDGIACRRGVAQVNKIVYAMCQEKTTFSGGLNLPEAVWYKVKWPVDNLGTIDVHQSSPDDRYSGWVIGIYLRPQTTLPVPAC